MLDFLIERSSWIIFKLGMPLVFLYHLLGSSIFLNTAAEDAQGFERIGNNALIPVHYFFAGKKATPIYRENETISYKFERRFDYHDHFYLKTAASFATLPLSLTVGSALKGLSYLSHETRERAQKLLVARTSTQVVSKFDYYRSIGMQIEDVSEAEMIDPPKWIRPPEVDHRLHEDVNALAEIVRILNTHEILFWLDCGTCLGTYQYGGAIPHDWDIDIAILVDDFENVWHVLQELDPKKYVVQDWSGRAKPKSYLKVLVRESGGMIDLYNFGFDEEKQELFTILSNEFNIFLPRSWVERELRYTKPMPFSYVFPLKKALYEGIEVPVPGQVEKYLQVFYGENLAPAKVYNKLTGQMEKDLNHPYWQLPHAH